MAESVKSGEARPRPVRVDCHLHSQWSGDSRTPLDRIEIAALAAGIDVVCITDHGTTAGAKVAATEFERVRIVIGQESRTWAGEIIGLFLNERIPGSLQPHDVIARIHAQGGLVYLPHPFCEMHNGLRTDFIERHLDEIDIIEVFNAKATAAGNAKAEDFAAEHDLAMGAGSDAHYAEFVGRTHMTIPDFSTSAEFLAALRSPEALIERGTYTHAESSWPRRV